jgi:hypothetical protein
MVTLHFIFNPGIWYGEGIVKVVSNDSELKYYAKWRIQEKKEGKIVAIQEVELEKTKEKTTNTFIFSQITQDSFLVALQNDLFGQVFGKGIISDIAIAWEFHGQDLAFEGFEIYQHLIADEYATRAEYVSSGEPHTVISGKLWRKSDEEVKVKENQGEK